MSLRLGDTAPDFEQDSTDGRIKFHDWIGNSWAILFSHPKDFTPVCTTELGEVARLKPEFDKRNTKVIGLSVDGLKEHQGWIGDIKETQGHALNFPLLADSDRKVSELYDMIHGPQFRRDHSCPRFLAAHGELQGGDAGQLARRR